MCVFQILKRVRKNFCGICIIWMSHKNPAQQSMSAGNVRIMLMNARNGLKMAENNHSRKKAKQIQNWLSTPQSYINLLCFTLCRSEPAFFHLQEFHSQDPGSNRGECFHTSRGMRYVLRAACIKLYITATTHIVGLHPHTRIRVRIHRWRQENSWFLEQESVKTRQDVFFDNFLKNFANYCHTSFSSFQESVLFLLFPHIFGKIWTLPSSSTTTIPKATAAMICNWCLNLLTSVSLWALSGAVYFTSNCDIHLAQWESGDSLWGWHRRCVCDKRSWLSDCLQMKRQVHTGRQEVMHWCLWDVGDRNHPRTIKRLGRWIVAVSTWPAWRFRCIPCNYSGMMAP